MRILCTCVPGFGHFHPMVPISLALEAAGHEVAFATEERFCRRVTRARFRAFPAGLGPGKVLERALALPGAAGPGPEDAWRFGAQMFAGVAAPAKVPDLLRIIEDWRPSLVVTDATDFAGPVAAASAGLPCAAHSLGPLFPLEFYRSSDGLLAPLWRDRGLAPRPLGGMFDEAYLDICPPSLQSADATNSGGVTHPLRPVPFDAVAGETLPGWIDDLAPQPTVYVTLGTLDNDAPGVFEAVLEGLGDEPMNVIVTIGPKPGSRRARPPADQRAHRTLRASIPAAPPLRRGGRPRGGRVRHWRRWPSDCPFSSCPRAPTSSGTQSGAPPSAWASGSCPTMSGRSRSAKPSAPC